MHFRVATQISVRIKDAIGGVKQVIDILRRRQSTSSLSVAMGNDHDASQLLITGPCLEEAAEELASRNLAFEQDQVILMKMDEVKGKLTEITHSFLESKIELDYICAASSLDQSTQSLIFKVSNIPLASRILDQAA